jgi:hypothetical protein
MGQVVEAGVQDLTDEVIDLAGAYRPEMQWSWVVIPVLRGDVTESARRRRGA